MADETQHRWILDWDQTRRELNAPDPTPPAPGLEAQGRPQTDFTEDIRVQFQWLSDSLPGMGNLAQAISMANNGIILFLQLPNIPDIPAYFMACALCQGYNFRGSLPITVGNT